MCYKYNIYEINSQTHVKTEKTHTSTLFVFFCQYQKHLLFIFVELSTIHEAKD